MFGRGGWGEGYIQLQHATSPLNSTQWTINFSHWQREQLTEVILRLLGAWGDPLSQFYQSMSQDQNQDFNHYSSNKALEISDMVHELRDGVAKMAERVRRKYITEFLFVVILKTFLYILISVTYCLSLYLCLKWVVSLESPPSDEAVGSAWQHCGFHLPWEFCAPLCLFLLQTGRAQINGPPWSAPLLPQRLQQSQKLSTYPEMHHPPRSGLLIVTAKQWSMIPLLLTTNRALTACVHVLCNARN